MGSRSYKEPDSCLPRVPFAPRAATDYSDPPTPYKGTITRVLLQGYYYKGTITRVL